MAEALEVLRVFVRLGLLGFGGALAILPEMALQVVNAHGWMSEREFADGYALGTLAPGPNMLAVVFYGFRAAGLPGAVAAALGMFAPAAAIAALMARLWGLMGEAPWPRAIRAALLPVGAGLMAGGALTLSRGAVTDLTAALIALAAGLAVYSGRAAPIAVVLAGGAAGLATALLAYSGGH